MRMAQSRMPETITNSTDTMSMVTLKRKSLRKPSSEASNGRSGMSPVIAERHTASAGEVLDFRHAQAVGLASAGGDGDRVRAAGARAQGRCGVSQGAHGAAGVR